MLWVPDRQDIIWIDCNPQVGREMRDDHPLLVLSPKNFNEKTSLVIGLPMATAEYNADNPFAVAVGAAKGPKAGKTSYVLCHQPKSFDWRLRGARAHPLKAMSSALAAINNCLYSFHTCFCVYIVRIRQQTLLFRRLYRLRHFRAKRISTLIQRLIKKHLPVHFRPDFFVQFFNLARIVGAVEAQFYFGLLCALFDH